MPTPIENCLALLDEGLRHVTAPYFLLTTTYEPSGIVRERAFCYELYHQIRSRMQDGCPITLNGEIDKRGHHEFAKKDQKNPDFVFHIPGTFRGNTLAVEVKGACNGHYRHGIIKDIRTLIMLIAKYEYAGGAFVLYNHSLHELGLALKSEAAAFAQARGVEFVHLRCIARPDAQIERATLDEVCRAITI